MKKKDAINYFGDQKTLAAAVGLGSSSISIWGESVPELYQFKLQVITDGGLKVDPKILPNILFIPEGAITISSKAAA